MSANVCSISRARPRWTSSVGGARVRHGAGRRPVAPVGVRRAEALATGADQAGDGVADLAGVRVQLGEQRAPAGEEALHQLVEAGPERSQGDRRRDAGARSDGGERGSIDRTGGWCGGGRDVEHVGLSGRGGARAGCSVLRSGPGGWSGLPRGSQMFPVPRGCRQSRRAAPRPVSYTRPMTLPGTARVIAASGRWHLGIGDPDAIAWCIVVAYAVAAALAGWACLTARRGARLAAAPRSAGSGEPRVMARCWLVVAIVLLGLGINKQLDLQTWLLQSMRRRRVRGWLVRRPPPLPGGPDVGGDDRRARRRHGRRLRAAPGPAPDGAGDARAGHPAAVRRRPRSRSTSSTRCSRTGGRVGVNVVLELSGIGCSQWPRCGGGCAASGWCCSGWRAPTAGGLPSGAPVSSATGEAVGTR